MQDRGFNSFASNMMKLAVLMKQNEAVCYPGPVLLFFIFQFENMILGPESYRDFQEMGPR